MMKVLFCIYSKEGTPGGHFFSLEHTLRVLSRNIDIAVLSIGNPPQVIRDLQYPLYQVSPRPDKRRTYVRILEEVKPDVVHCFDSVAYSFFSLAMLGKKYKCVLTNAGGPVPGKIYPYCKDIIVFSKENLSFFEHCGRFDGVNLSYIPNRVCCDLLQGIVEHPHTTPTFIQIIRIQQTKHNQIKKTLNFLKMLHDRGVNFKLILAGTVKSEKEKDFILKFIKHDKLENNFELITDSRVNKGSTLLGLGDFVIATGRSVMEAASLGKVILVPTKNCDYPVLLDPDNFENLFDYNFSGRTTKEYDETEFNKIEAIIKDDEYRNTIKKYTFDVCQKYFVITPETVSKFMNIYSNAKELSTVLLVKKNWKTYLKALARVYFYYPFKRKLHQ